MATMQEALLAALRAKRIQPWGSTTAGETPPIVIQSASPMEDEGPDGPSWSDKPPITAGTTPPIITQPTAPPVIVEGVVDRIGAESRGEEPTTPTGGVAERVGAESRGEEILPERGGVIDRVGEEAREPDEFAVGRPAPHFEPVFKAPVDIPDASQNYWQETMGLGESPYWTAQDPSRYGPPGFQPPPPYTRPTRPGPATPDVPGVPPVAGSPVPMDEGWRYESKPPTAPTGPSLPPGGKGGTVFDPGNTPPINPERPVSPLLMALRQQPAMQTMAANPLIAALRGRR